MTDTVPERLFGAEFKLENLTKAELLEVISRFLNDMFPTDAEGKKLRRLAYNVRERTLWDAYRTAHNNSAAAFSAYMSTPPARTLKRAEASLAYQRASRNDRAAYKRWSDFAFIYKSGSSS